MNLEHLLNGCCISIDTMAFIANCKANPSWWKPERPSLRERLRTEANR